MTSDQELAGDAIEEEEAVDDVGDCEDFLGEAQTVPVATGSLERVAARQTVCSVALASTRMAHWDWEQELDFVSAAFRRTFDFVAVQDPREDRSSLAAAAASWRPASAVVDGWGFRSSC